MRSYESDGKGCSGDRPLRAERPLHLYREQVTSKAPWDKTENAQPLGRASQLQEAGAVSPESVSTSGRLLTRSGLSPAGFEGTKPFTGCQVTLLQIKGYFGYSPV